ncbi:MAG: peptidylprolyl isomerase [Candidatus Aminicenantes bacterium]|nr:peptidylprolyl isomerase [Candidatus Aminicenantes bacterium]
MKRIVRMFAPLILAAVLAAQTAAPAQKPDGEPDRITLQHILISFLGSAGTVPDVTRTQAEAKALAEMILGLARQGGDYGALVKQYTDDRAPGIYKMANFGVDPIQGPPSKKEYARAKMVAAFGDVGFKLKVGEVGLAVYDPIKSKYGWHVIKRLE